MLKHLDITITGKVQKVGFRFTALQIARRNSISGIVRNAGKNRVCIEAEGSDQDLDQFLMFCVKGPVGADIEKVEVGEGDIKHFTNFDIVYT